MTKKYIRNAELNYKLAEISSDINHILNLCNIESLKVPDWIVANVRDLKLTYNRVKSEVQHELKL